MTEDFDRYWSIRIESGTELNSLITMKLEKTGFSRQVTIKERDKKRKHRYIKQTQLSYLSDLVRHFIIIAGMVVIKTQETKVERNEKADYAMETRKEN